MNLLEIFSLANKGLAWLIFLLSEFNKNRTKLDIFQLAKCCLGYCAGFAFINDINC